MTRRHTTDHFGEVVSNLRQLESDNVVVRLQARNRLVRMSKRAVPHLVEALRYAGRRQRWEAAKALAEIADPASAPALVGMLEDDDPGIRWVAAEALEALESDALAPVLEGLISRSDSPQLRIGATHVLQGLCEGELRTLITPVLAAIRGPAPDIAAPVAACNALNAWRRESSPRTARVAATSEPTA